MQKVRFYGILIPLKLLIKKTNVYGYMLYYPTLKFKVVLHPFFLNIMNRNIHTVRD